MGRAISVRRWPLWTTILSVLVLLTCSYVLVRPIPVTALSLRFDGVPAGGAFQVFFLRKKHYTKEDLAYQFVWPSTEPIELRFFFPSLSADVRRIRFDPGPVPTRLRLLRVAFHTGYYDWRPEIAHWPLGDFASKARLMKGIAKLALDDTGLEIVADSIDPYFDVPFSLDTLYAGIPVKNRIAIRAQYMGWVLLAGLLVWVSPWVVYGFVMLVRTRRKDALARPANFWTKNRSWLIAGLLSLVVVNAIRIWTTLRHPGLYAEDAPHYFSKANNHAYSLWSRGLYFAPNGYFTFLPSLAAKIASFADVRIQPAIYSVFSFLCTTTASVVLTLSGLIRRRELMIVAPLVLGLSGINLVLFYTSLMATIYPLTIILLSLLLHPAPRTSILYVGLIVLSILLVWSGPYSAMAIPAAIALFLFFGERRKNVFLGLIVVAAIVSLSFEKQNLSVGSISNPEWYIYVSKHAFHTYMREVCFFGFIDNPSLGHGVVIVALIGFAFLYLRKDRVYVKTAIVTLGISLGSLLVYFFSIKYVLYHGELNSGHTVISTFFWTFFLVLTLDRLISTARRPTALTAAVVTGIAAFVIVDNIIHVDKRYYRPHAYLAEFLSAVRAVQDLHSEKDRVYVLTQHSRNQEVVE